MWLGSITNVIFHIEFFVVVVVYFRFLFLFYYFFFHFFNWDNLFGQGLCGDKRLLLLGKLDRSLSSRRGAGQQAVGKSRDQCTSDQKKKKIRDRGDSPRDRGDWAHFAATNSLSWLRPSCEAWTCLHLP